MLFEVIECCRYEKEWRNLIQQFNCHYTLIKLRLADGLLFATLCLKFSCLIKRCLTVSIQTTGIWFESHQISPLQKIKALRRPVILTLGVETQAPVSQTSRPKGPPTWMTLPYWITVPRSFLFSDSFCFFSRSAACWKERDAKRQKHVKRHPCQCLMPMQWHTGISRETILHGHCHS